MKIIGVSLLMLGSFLNASAQKPVRYNITGDIKGLNKDTIIMSVRMDKKVFRSDTTITKQGRFHFTGHVPKPAGAFLSVKKKGLDMSFSLFLESGKISIKGNADSSSEVIISGTPGNDDLAILEKQEAAAYAPAIKLRGLHTEAKKKNDSIAMAVLEKQMDSAYTPSREKVTAIRTQFVKDHPSSAASTVAIYLVQDDLSWKELEDLYAVLDDQYHETGYTEGISDKIAANKRVSIGQQAPDFAAKDSSGKDVSLKEFRGKFVLVDFWASWCVPCRQENKNVLAVYSKYKDKNFTVLGFSMDEKGERWKKALVQDKLPWTNISDLLFFNSPIAKSYGVQPIPDNFLISPDGKILGRRLYGDELDKMVASALGIVSTVSAEEVSKYPDSLSLIRQYISSSGSSSDSLALQFDDWIKQFPKSSALPFAIGEKYYQERNKKSFGYLYKSIILDSKNERLGKMFSVAADQNWDLDVARTPSTVDSLERVIEAQPDSLLPLQQYVFLLGITNDTVTKKFEAWMKKYPKSTSFPFVLGESFYSRESPKAKPYLLKVVEADPKNAKVWEMLSIDAERWGDNDAAREYMGKASAAKPEDASYAFYYAMDFEQTDAVKWKNMLYDLTKKFPSSERGAQALYWMAFRTVPAKEKIKIFEQLKKLYPPAKFEWSSDGMSGLYDVYLSDGQPEKARALALSMGKEGEWVSKVTLADKVISINKLLSQKKYKEAYSSVNSINVPKYSGINNKIALLKAKVAVAGGNVSDGYDSLLSVQAKGPDAEIETALNEYGSRLGKNTEEVKKDLWQKRELAIKPAPDFSLGLYTSAEKSSLKDYQGKVVLLTFWFPGCGPCRGEFPHFENVIRKFKNKQVSYLGINVFPDQDEYVMPFMLKTKYSFIPLRGSSDWAKETYKVRGEPTNFLIDQNGRIVFSDFRIDVNNEQELEMMINEILAYGGTR
jgi:peroxiredoxin/TolA-binding protein